MSRKLGRFLLLLFAFAARSSYGQVEKLMYDSIPRYSPDTIPVFHDYNAHMFFGYDDCTKFIDLKYGFIHKYEGHLRRISYRIMHYDWLNRQWSKQMRRRNGPIWVDSYYQELRACREESVFQNYVTPLPDTSFTKIHNVTTKAELLRVPPMQFLRYLSTTIHHSGLNATGQSVPLEMRRDVKFLLTTKDNWITKTDVAKLIQYIYSNYGGMRRACLCADTVLLGQPTTVGLEAFKLISLYRGHNYPTSFPSVSRSEVDELFRWWLKERMKP